MIHSSWIGVLNAVAIIITNEIYSYLVGIAVRYENNRYEKDQTNSYIMKTFVFQFVNSYIQLFYYMFVIGGATDEDEAYRYSLVQDTILPMIIVKQGIDFLKVL